MTDAVTVTMGDMRVSHNPAVLQSAGIGSCLAIILYDPVAHVGGLAHAMLPVQAEGGASKGQPLRFVDASIHSMMSGMKALGGDRKRYIAKLVGGAHMFALLGDGRTGIGAQNLDAARRILQQEGIPVTSEETGGSVGRNVSFDLRSGICSVETKM